MDLFLALVAATTFPLVCLGFLLVMARLEDSIPEGLSRIGRTPDPAPIVAVPVRRTTAEVPAQVRETPPSTVRNPTLNGIPVQRSEPPATPVLPPAAATAATPVLPPAVAPEPEPLAGT
jgi:hypothetical protein